MHNSNWKSLHKSVSPGAELTKRGRRRYRLKFVRPLSLPKQKEKLNFNEPIYMLLSALYYQTAREARSGASRRPPTPQLVSATHTSSGIELKYLPPCIRRSRTPAATCDARAAINKSGHRNAVHHFAHTPQEPVLRGDCEENPKCGRMRRC
ncbi:hypothetical protein EVAR_9976_1 [Eumeta japonica]|uniref:Uncharacterized protein n=1 Tax=Eumeta variegata TaxID=151549 RepID=A0A4C1TR49_EUMVA|nr:hypothetical protein EVAR_9976_1 [Eumeta japonica]